MPASPSGDMATHIAAQMGSGYTVNTNVFAGPPRELDGNFTLPCIFAQIYGGPKPLWYRVEQEELKELRLVVTVKSASDAYETGEAVAHAVREAIRFTVPSGYKDITPRDGFAVYTGVDEKYCHCFVLNFYVLLEE